MASPAPSRTAKQVSTPNSVASESKVSTPGIMSPSSSSAMLLQGAPGPAPKVIPGSIKPENEGAIDWGTHHFLAYGCSSFVVVADPHGEQIVQTLDGHRSRVTALKWADSPLSHAYPDPLTQTVPVLASGDDHGVVMVWDVRSATAIHTFTDARAPVAKVEWMPSHDDRLAVLHQNTTSVILYDTLKGAKMWRWDSSESIHSLAFDPYNPVHMGLAGSGGWLYFYNSIAKGPASSADLKFRLQTASKSDELLDIIFWPHARDVCLFVLPKEVMVFDLKVQQVLCSIGVEKHRAELRTVRVSLDDGARLYCLHSDGSITVYAKKSSTSWIFEQQSYGDALRINKQSKKSKCLGVAVSPLHPSRLATIYADGRLWLWSYGKDATPQAPTSLLTSGLNETIYRFRCEALVQCVNPEVMSQAVSPFSTPNESLMAFGTRSGTIQVVDLASGSVRCEMQVFDNSVRGVRWLSADILVVYCCKELKPGVFKNHLCTLNIESGAKKAIRPPVLENTYIRGTRLSYRAQYLVVLLKDKPFEMWDLVSMSLLRVFRAFPSVTAFEWMSPTESSPYRPRATSIFDPSHQRTPTRTKEQFVFINSDGTLNHFTIEGETITANPQTKSDYGSGLVVCVAWKEGILVTADTSGVITVRNFREKTAQQILTHRGVIRSLRFSQVPHDYVLAVLFAEGEFGLWDASTGKGVATSRSRGTGTSSPSHLTIGLEWSGGNLVTVTKEGYIRVLERTDTVKGNSAIVARRLARSLSHPALLPPAVQLALRHACHRGHVGSVDESAAEGVVVGSDSVADISKYLAGESLPPGPLSEMLGGDPATPTEAVSGEPSLIDMNSAEALSSDVNAARGRKGKAQRTRTTYFGLNVTDNPSPGTLPPSYLADQYSQQLPAALVSLLQQDTQTVPMEKRALEIARYFGDIQEVRLWQLAIHYLPWYADRPARPPAASVSVASLRVGGQAGRSQSVAAGSGDSVPPLSVSPANGSASTSSAKLPQSLDLLRHRDECHTEAVVRADRISYDDMPYSLAKTNCAKRVLLGEHEKAIQLLLETPADHENFYQDALKACVVAGALSREQYENTMKIVATYLIANGSLDEGVQFLCLINKGLDACRYLQSYDKWVEAAQLAKTTLSPDESAVVHLRWAEHLIKIARESDAIEVFMSLGEFARVLSLLHQGRRVDTAYLLLEALQAYPLLAKSVPTDLGDSIKKAYDEQLKLLGHDPAAVVRAPPQVSLAEPIVTEAPVSVSPTPALAPSPVEATETTPAPAAEPVTPADVPRVKNPSPTPILDSTTAVIDSTTDSTSDATPVTEPVSSSPARPAPSPPSDSQLIDLSDNTETVAGENGDLIKF